MKASKVSNTLPEGWILAKLSDMVLDPKNDFVDGPFGSNLKATEYTNEGYPVFRIQNIKAGYFLDKNIQFVTEKKFENLKRHSFKLGDIIITKLGEPLGLCCKVPIKYPTGVIVADLMRIRPYNQIVDTDYLVFAINSKLIQDQFKRITKGTTRSRVNLRIVRDLSIPLAPLNEQKRIVNKLEEILSELESGKEQLATAYDHLRIYRQAVIKSAFEGKLTEEWRKQQVNFIDGNVILNQIKEKRESENNNSKKIRSLTKDEHARLPEIPKGWIWCRNEELMDYTTSGSRDWKKYYNSSGALFIRTQDIKTNSLILENVAKVKLPKKVEGKRSLVEPNDLLMTITGANVGKIAHIDTKIKEAYVSQSVALMKFTEKKISRFLYYFFQARDFGGTFIEKMVYGVGRPVLSLENIKDVPVCICSFEEQNKIVEELDSILSICDKLEDIISKNIEQSEALKQSILFSAFQGKLLKQRTLDEHASILLQRLNHEREVYLEAEKLRRKLAPKLLKANDMTEKLKSIIQVLRDKKKPISTYLLWKSTEHKEDIDAFYAKLKEHVDKGEIKELPRKGKETFLTISNSK